MKIGDLVVILESTMGTKLETGVIGILLAKVESSSNTLNRWRVLINGSVREIDEPLLKKAL